MSLKYGHMFFTGQMANKLFQCLMLLHKLCFCNTFVKYIKFSLSF